MDDGSQGHLVPGTEGPSSPCNPAPRGGGFYQPWFSLGLTVPCRFSWGQNSPSQGFTNMLGLRTPWMRSHPKLTKPDPRRGKESVFLAGWIKWLSKAFLRATLYQLLNIQAGKPSILFLLASSPQLPAASGKGTVWHLTLNPVMVLKAA